MMPVSVVLMLMLTSFAGVGNASPLGHKSKAELAAMTPAQRVDEACEEYVRHSYSHSEYWEQLEDYILADGLKAVPEIVRIIDAYEPAQDPHVEAKAGERFYAAQGLLSQIDNSMRLRGTDAGRKAIAACERLLERMKAAHFDTADSSDPRFPRYGGSFSTLEDIKGISGYDKAIRYTLNLKYGIRLSDAEFADFIDYLVSHSPDYPTWSGGKQVKDLSDVNEAGYAAWHDVLDDPEPFHKAFLEYSNGKRAR